MQEEFVKEHFEGYCKVHNSNKHMIFEYSQDARGNLCLEKADCDFDKCKYSGGCYILQQAFAKEDE